MKLLMIGRSAALFALALAALAARPAGAVTIEEVKSAKGVTAWLVEDHSVPVVSVSAAFRGGSALDPVEEGGLANFTVDLLDEGAGELDSTAYQSKLEDLAAEVNFSASPDMVFARLRSLSKNLGASCDMLRLALTQPRFDAAPVARVRAAILESLAHEAQQPYAIANRLWWQSAFPDHPYGRSSRGTAATVEAIKPEDMRRFITERFAKDALIVAVVGDVTPAELSPLLDQVFGDLPEKAATAALPPVTMRHVDHTKVVALPIPQSTVVFGEPGIKRDDPDWYAALLDLNVLSSGGLTSRLAQEVREKRGLAYSVSASLNPLKETGVIIGQVGSRNAQVAESIDVIRDTWRKMHDEGPSEKELAAAKTYITGSFPLTLDSTGRLGATLVSIQFDRLGIDYLEKRDALINGVTLADAKRVAARILKPEDLFFVVVGQPENLADAERVTPGG